MQIFRGTFKGLFLIFSMIAAFAIITNLTQAVIISWKGFDWDGGQEVTLNLNGKFLVSLPASNSPQNAQIFVPFSVNTSKTVQGPNTLVFIHANWDCGVSANVENFTVNDGITNVFIDPSLH